MLKIDKIEGIDKIIATVKALEKSVKHNEGLNKARAKAFKAYTTKAAQQGGLGLKPISGATKKIHKGWHQPMYHKGEFFKAMEIRTKKGGHNQYSEVGFFRSSSKKPKKSKLTWYTIAKLHTTGYRVPLTGPKGKKVRGYLAAHGIFVRKSRKFLHVRPRPVMLNALRRYRERGIDDRVISRYLKKIFGGVR